MKVADRGQEPKLTRCYFPAFQLDTNAKATQQPEAAFTYHTVSGWRQIQMICCEKGSRCKDRFFGIQPVGLL